MVDDLAARGYGSEDQPYHRARPNYPGAAVEALLQALHLKPGMHVVELGAGTGIFSRSLVDRGLRVIAVEPVAAMRAKLAANVSVEIADSSAEETGLPDRIADAVVAATAWHWFDGPRAIREVGRLLKPAAGGLGLLWNSYDESVPWVADLARIADRRRPSSQPSERSGRWLAAFEDRPGWAPLAQKLLPNPWPTTGGGIIDRVLSSSVISALPADERERVRQEVVDLLAAHRIDAAARVTLPYRTSIYWTRPL